MSRIRSPANLATFPNGNRIPISFAFLHHSLVKTQHHHFAKSLVHHFPLFPIYSLQLESERWFVSLSHVGLYLALQGRISVRGFKWGRVDDSGRSASLGIGQHWPRVSHASSDSDSSCSPLFVLPPPHLLLLLPRASLHPVISTPMRDPLVLDTTNYILLKPSISFVSLPCNHLATASEVRFLQATIHDIRLTSIFPHHHSFLSLTFSPSSYHNTKLYLFFFILVGTKSKSRLLMHQQLQVSVSFQLSTSYRPQPSESFELYLIMYQPKTIKVN